MASQQGFASVSLRKKRFLFTADSLWGGQWDEQRVLRGATVVDYEAYSQVVPENATNAELGDHLRNALLESRIDRPDGWFDPLQRGSSLRLANAFGLKSAGSVYQGMRMISACWALGTIELLPTLRRFRGVFEYYAKTDNSHRQIAIPFDASSNAVGQAVRECIGRCIP